MVLGLLIASLGAASPAPAQQASASQVKAAFLYNFAKFVEWPPGTFDSGRADITLGILERDPLAGALASLQGKEVQGRKIVVKRSQGIDELKKCHIFFASASEISDLPKILDALKGRPVLTVTDEVDDFARLGVIINLNLVGDKIRFGIDVKNAEKCGLKISSQLLKLAIRRSN